jgi:hypothetical protein
MLHNILYHGWFGWERSAVRTSLLRSGPQGQQAMANRDVTCTVLPFPARPLCLLSSLFSPGLFPDFFF